jgi:hypothetical protein
MVYANMWAQGANGRTFDAARPTGINLYAMLPA